MINETLLSCEPITETTFVIHQLQHITSIVKVMKLFIRRNLLLKYQKITIIQINLFKKENILYSLCWWIKKIIRFSSAIVYMRVCVYIYVCMYVCMYVYVCVCICVYVYIFCPLKLNPNFAIDFTLSFMVHLPWNPFILSGYALFVSTLTFYEK